MDLAGVAPSAVAAVAALGTRLESLGLLRNGRPGVWLQVGLALAGFSALKKTSDALSRAKLNNFVRDSYDWPRELVVLTGGSSGIGAQVLQKLAKHGIKVINLDIVPPKDPLPSNVFFYRLDLANSGDIKEVADQIRKDHGDPTVLINNAGITNRVLLLQKTEEQIRRVFDVNIISHFVLIKEFLPAMAERNHGHIVTVASMASFTGTPLSAEYAASKAGALALIESLAQELRFELNAPKVRTSIIHPSFVLTPLVEKAYAGAKNRPRYSSAADLGDVIVKHVLSGNSGQVIFPRHMSIVSGIRGWPSWIQEMLRDTMQRYSPAKMA